MADNKEIKKRLSIGTVNLVGLPVLIRKRSNCIYLTILASIYNNNLFLTPNEPEESVNLK